jgi:hypothetical protein
VVVAVVDARSPPAQNASYRSCLQSAEIDIDEIALDYATTRAAASAKQGGVDASLREEVISVHSYTAVSSAKKKHESLYLA